MVHLPCCIVILLSRWGTAGTWRCIWPILDRDAVGHEGWSVGWMNARHGEKRRWLSRLFFEVVTGVSFVGEIRVVWSDREEEVQVTWRPFLNLWICSFLNLVGSQTTQLNFDGVEMPWKRILCLSVILLFPSISGCHKKIRFDSSSSLNGNHKPEENFTDNKNLINSCVNTLLRAARTIKSQ